MPARPGRQINHRPRNILRLPQPHIRVHGRHGLLPPTGPNKPRSHLRREEPGRDTVDEDMPWAQLDSEVAGKVDHGGFGRGVAVGAVVAEGADAQAGDGGGDDHTGGVVDGGALLEKRRESGGGVEGQPVSDTKGLPVRTRRARTAQAHNVQPDGVEHALDVQVHHLRERAVGVRVELLPPRRAGVREQDVHVVGRLLHFLHQPFHVGDLGGVGGDGDGLGAGALVGEGVERGAGGVAGGGFAGGDVDFGAACLEEAGRVSAGMAIGEGRRTGGGGRCGKTYADAACRPRPRDPPVTTTTLPSREKREGKSLSSVCAFASAADMMGRTE